jgi:N-acetylmuramoyl-L-alanine amidase
MIRLVRIGTASLLLFLAAACSAPPAPVSVPAAAAADPAPPPQGPSTVYVTASALNVRRDASADAELVTQVKRDAALAVVARREGWVQVRLEDGRTGWVAERFVASERAAPVASGRRRTPPARVASGAKRGCESDYAFVETPKLTFSETDASGLVVVEASVSAQGEVTSTKVITNTTGEKRAAEAAEREIRSARFAPPMRNCQPRAFVFTYRRTF